MRTETNRSTDIARTETRAVCSRKAHPDDTESAAHRGLIERMVHQAMTLPFSAKASPTRGSLDGDGSADHDQPYRFGLRPRTSAPYPFSTRQYARLLVLRGRVQDQVGAALELVPLSNRQRGLRPAA